MRPITFWVDFEDSGSSTLKAALLELKHQPGYLGCVTGVRTLLGWPRESHATYDELGSWYVVPLPACIYMQPLPATLITKQQRNAPFRQVLPFKVRTGLKPRIDSPRQRSRLMLSLTGVGWCV